MEICPFVSSHHVPPLLPPTLSFPSPVAHPSSAAGDDFDTVKEIAKGRWFSVFLQWRVVVGTHPAAILFGS